VETLFAAKKYLHCLFFAHLVLEKLCKAHWVKNNEENIPPKIHKLLWILGGAKVDLGEEKMMFLREFDKFQLSTRYPDYVGKLYRSCTKAYAEHLLEQVKSVRECLLKEMP